MPRWILKVPYDILNRFNRNKLKANNESIVDSVKVEDYAIQDLTDNCLDYFCIATK